MNRYQTQTPRMAFGLAAIAMAALTLAVAVVAPAQFDARTAAASVLAGAGTGASTPIEVAIVPREIKVIGIRPANLASARVSVSPAAGKPQS